LVGLAVRQFRSIATANAAGVSTCVIYMLATTFWDQRSEAWYVPFVTSAVLFHVLLVFSISWPGHYSPGKQDALFGLADLIVLVVLAFLTAKQTHAPSSVSDKQSF
jgi:hypothetical protein